MERKGNRTCRGCESKLDTLFHPKVLNF
jgi:hypothetical protein